MKRIFLMFAIMTAFILAGLTVHAKTNYLHSIILEKNRNSYNVILKSDEITKIVRKSLSDNELVLELSGITSSDTVNALYKGTNDIDNLVVESTSPNKLKIYITAPNISTSSIFLESENGNGTLVGESFPRSKAIWATFVLVVFCLIIRRSRKKTLEDSSSLIKKDIKDREIELYRRYRKNFEEENMNANKNTKMKTMLKKIDRKIDERLMSSIK